MPARASSKVVTLSAEKIKLETPVWTARAAEAASSAPENESAVCMLRQDFRGEDAAAAELLKMEHAAAALGSLADVASEALQDSQAAPEGAASEAGEPQEPASSKAPRSRSRKKRARVESSSKAGCEKLARVGGNCSAHGGGRSCGYSGCEKRARTRGMCSAHARAVATGELV
ncbi:Hypothetical Protein FCC1311_049512 [Hondaea fermentalgiana]|uniref:Uncharacterized protein n=1 Tax=Hondaea fermentalgiana TaxID=2315210 RepID=A0A2R5GCM2_9STRA|nr:Hypothetical Protein FCC1311_049512 [Hondaea fermentalgiana]|eukprot:GBG28730.1 Hypothetical Protein FCC1311_049512 [Hondaea fermentalgiana]